MRLALEPVVYEGGVDLVFNGCAPAPRPRRWRLHACLSHLCRGPRLAWVHVRPPECIRVCMRVPVTLRLGVRCGSEIV